MVKSVKRTRRDVSGILLLDKATGPSSNSVLQRAKYIYGAKKVGHTGTLDPLANGMLPLCFGEATKFVRFLIESHKCYRVVAKLGAKTTTQDSTGDITATFTIPSLSIDLILQTLQSFVGESEQIPPMYSAIKIQGKKLYELARRGVEVERKPRMVTISNIELNSVNLNSQEDSTISFTVTCSKGTYIRTLVEDFGDKLGVGAHVTALRRLWSSPFEGLPMCTLDTLDAVYEREGFKGLDALLLPLEVAVAHLPKMVLPTYACEDLQQGRIFESGLFQKEAWLQLWGEEGKFIGIGEVKDSKVFPRRLLATRKNVNFT